MRHDISTCCRIREWSPVRTGNTGSSEDGGGNGSVSLVHAVSTSRARGSFASERGEADRSVRKEQKRCVEGGSNEGTVPSNAAKPGNRLRLRGPRCRVPQQMWILGLLLAGMPFISGDESRSMELFRCPCSNAPPPNTAYSCSQLRAMGQCERLEMQGHCQCHCEQCEWEAVAEEEALDADGRRLPPCSICNDTPPPLNTMPCAALAALSYCQEPWMHGFCQLTCGTCPDDCPAASSSLPDASAEPPEPEEEDDWAVLDAWDELNDTASSLTGCRDSPPELLPGSCEEAAARCGESWMEGYCQVTCGGCADGEQADPSAATMLAEVPDAAIKHYLPQQAARPQRAGGDGKRLKFRLLHYNDMHSRVEQVSAWGSALCYPKMEEEGSCHGGIARMKTFLDNQRAGPLPVLLLDAGDTIIGSKWDQRDDGKEVAHFVKTYVKPDAMVLGNHEFDRGPESLARFLSELPYPVLSCNLEPRGHRVGNLVRKSTVVTVDGVKVGIVGFTTEVTQEWSNPYPVWFKKVYEVADGCIRDLKGRGAKIIIALSHAGYKADTYIARRVKDIDIIVGGHSHTFLKAPNEPLPKLNQQGDTDWTLGPYPTWMDSWVQPGRRIPVLQAGWATKYMGSLVVEFDEEGELVSLQGNPEFLGGWASGHHQVKENAEVLRDIRSRKWWPDHRG